jgi:hypothetical protein
MVSISKWRDEETKMLRLSTKICCDVGNRLEIQQKMNILLIRFYFIVIILACAKSNRSSFIGSGESLYI